MRYLHPVAVSEKFIAKGVYRFYQGEVQLPKTETWTRHRLAGGGILTRIDREGEFEGLTTLIEALTDEAGQIERLNVREWNKSAQAAYQTLRADYVFFDDYVQASRRINERETEHDEFHIAPETIIDLPITVFAGVKWTQLAKRERAPVSVLRPVWWQINDPLIALEHDLTTEMSSSIHGGEDSQDSATSYRITPDHFIVVNKHGIPLQCQDHDHLTKLTESAHI